MVEKEEVWPCCRRCQSIQNGCPPRVDVFALVRQTCPYQAMWSVRVSLAEPVCPPEWSLLTQTKVFRSPRKGGLHNSGFYREVRMIP